MRPPERQPSARAVLCLPGGWGRLLSGRRAGFGVGGLGGLTGAVGRLGDPTGIAGWLGWLGWLWLTDPGWLW